MSDLLLASISQAEERLCSTLEQAESTYQATIDSGRRETNEHVQAAIGESPEQVSARETIEHLQLRLELLRNMRMNWPLLQAHFESDNLTMRLNQDAHLQHLISFLETGQGKENLEDVDAPVHDPARALMTYEVQPTGAGKTGCIAVDVALCGVPSLTLVPMDPLLRQTKNGLMKIGGIPEDHIGIVGGGIKETGRRHMIATYAGHAALLKSNPEYAAWVKQHCKLVICDEVHHQALGPRMQESIAEIDEALDTGEMTREQKLAMLEGEQEAIGHLNEATATKSLKIGLTATARGSKKHVAQYYPHCLGHIYLRQMIDAGYIVPYTIIQSDGSVYAGEITDKLTEEEEAAIHEREGSYGKLIGEYSDLLATYKTSKDRKQDMPLRCMAFVTNHAECIKFADEAWEQHGLKCRIVTGKEAKGGKSQEVIDDAVDALVRGDIDMIVTVEKLAIGFDRSEINAIISARITSAAKIVQYCGRGTRTHTEPDGRKKKECFVFEMNWTLKDAKKRGRRPHRLADAIAYNGDDPETSCRMASGATVDYERELTREELLEKAREVLAGHKVRSRMELFGMGLMNFLATDFAEFGKGRAFITAVLGLPEEGYSTLAHMEQLADALGWPEESPEELLNRARAALAEKGITSRKELLRMGGSGDFVKTLFTGFGKGESFITAVIGLEKKAGKTFMARLEDFADALGWLGENREQLLNRAKAALAEHGVTSRIALREMGKMKFIKTKFTGFGKGEALFSAVVRILPDRQDILLAHLEELADTLGWVVESREELLSRARAAMAEHGITSRKELITTGVVKFLKKNFTGFGRGRAFFSAIVRTLPVTETAGGTICMSHLEELADAVGWLAETREELLSRARVALAEHHITSKADLMNLGANALKKIQFTDFGKGQALFGSVVRPLNNESFATAQVRELADALGW